MAALAVCKVFASWKIHLGDNAGSAAAADDEVKYDDDYYDDDDERWTWLYDNDEKST